MSRVFSSAGGSPTVRIVTVGFWLAAPLTLGSHGPAPASPPSSPPHGQALSPAWRHDKRPDQSTDSHAEQYPAHCALSIPGPAVLGVFRLRRFTFPLEDSEDRVLVRQLLTARDRWCYMREFEFGWAIWTALPVGEVPPIGTGNMTVLDRETGRISHWPPWSIETLAQAYASHRGASRQGGQRCPDATFRSRNGPPRSAAWIAWAALTAPDGRRWSQDNALADDLPRHHPLVAQ